MPAATVEDSAGVRNDPAFQFLKPALDPRTALAALTQPTGPLGRCANHCGLSSIRVIRHKPGRRCLIEYGLQISAPWRGSRSIALIGKVRAKGLDSHAYGIQYRLASLGLGPSSRHGVSVPPVAGYIPAFHMWLQHRVPGVPAEIALTGTNGDIVARRVAEALAVFHACAAGCTRRHAVPHELAILEERFRSLSTVRPELSERLGSVFEQCRQVASGLSDAPTVGLHRDFYQDNVLIDGSRVWILDVDLYSRGPAAIDVGNFAGHLSELRVRASPGTPYLERTEQTFIERSIDVQSGRISAADVEITKTLTLARHVSLSSQIAGRESATGMLLELVEERLAGPLSGTGSGF